MFIMSYGYNPQALRPSKVPDRAPVVGQVLASNRVKNDEVVTMDTLKTAKLSDASRKKVLDYLDTIKKRTEMANDQAQKQGLPYRLNVYSDSTRAFMDILIIDGNEKELNQITREITHSNVGDLLDSITSGSGLIIDDLPPKL
jgi:hypothetical protein